MALLGMSGSYNLDNGTIDREVNSYGQLLGVLIFQDVLFCITL
jgi:hypothetical protein